MSDRGKNLIFAADLGGTHLRAATVDECGKIHFRSKQNTPQGTDPNKIVSAVVSAVRECRQELGSAAGDLKAVSLVVPGPVNVEEGTVVKAPNLYGHRHTCQVVLFGLRLQCSEVARLSPIS